ncbi:hypothetical protein Salmuc_03173 [Salipiger mucosus DSM 16094]|uniref:Mannosyltransferase OCH1 n=1 Tax=Salipiger mucosus DSM 16094 TaxID=1123237 RepID=S9RNI8_9RHOB|nr:hypothetical protein Salmuc_03173 [Salipiger mucosus DSM 16094]
MLDALEARFPGTDLAQQRLRLLIDEGRPDEALALAEAGGLMARNVTSRDETLRLHLCQGRLAEAERVAGEIVRALGVGNHHAAQFSVTLSGAMLNELRIFHRVAGQGEGRSLVRDIYEPARQVIDAWEARLSPPPGAFAPGAPAAIPRRIVQYWNAEDPPPEVGKVMEGWRRAAGFDYRCHNRASALRFLAQTYDDRHARAFRLANNAAEECDFLRLCLLLAEGGIYSDADDMLAGDPGALLAGAGGMLVAREPFRAIANNVICARPGHPVLKIAVDMAREALLSRANDGTWSKTGPGLFTRAIAAYLVDCETKGTEPDLRIMPQYRLNRFVTPHVRLSYKTTSKYWNARSRDAATPTVRALARLAAGERGELAVA